MENYLIVKQIRDFAATYDAFGNRTITTGTTAVTRGYCGVHQHYPSFDIIDMGGRMYDPIVGRFTSPDPYIQDWENSQNFNRYSYCLNNPLKYTDPSGEFWFTPILIGAGIFGIGNLTTHAIARDIKNFGQGVKMFAQGALVGATLGATTQIPGVSNFLASTWNFSKWGFAAIGTATLGSSFIGNVSGKNNEVFSNSLKIIGGLFSLDESNFFRGIWQGISRFTWESFQTNVGLCYSLTRNIGWRVDYVNYLGGATYSVNQNSSKIDGVSIGNYIGININDEISGNFGNYIRTVHNGLFMHEYGHTIQSRHYGLAYLFNIGIPSLFDAKNHRKGPHRERWFERKASAYGRDYFGNYWTTYSIYPTYGF